MLRLKLKNTNFRNAEKRKVLLISEFRELMKIEGRLKFDFSAWIC